MGSRLDVTPLIEPRTHRSRIVRHICRLQESSRNAVVLYARFIGDTTDYGCQGTRWLVVQ